MSASSNGHNNNNTDAHKMHILSRGALQDIAKPASPKVRAGSRPQAMSTSSASTQGYASRVNSSMPPNIDILSPEELMENHYDLELEDLGSSGSEYTDGSDDGITGRTESIFGIAEPLSDRSKAAVPQFDAQSQQSEEDYLAVRQLALLENESSDISVDSDEERDIMAEIRAEITDKVREEMKSELELYQKAKDNLNKPSQAEPENDDLKDVDPKLKEAILKMRKLDKILVKREKREKQVKRERLMLQKRLKEELLNLKCDSQKKITHDEEKNTEKFLMLTLPPNHNAGISTLNPEAESPPVTPVFQTQIPDEGPRGADGDSTRSQTVTGGRSTGISQSDASSVSGTSTMTTDSKGRKIRRKKKKDFIKRNMQLASDAANTIAMTDDEKRRIEDLLADIETLPELPEDDESVQSRLKRLTWNP